MKFLNLLANLLLKIEVDVRALNAEGIIESPKKGAYVFNGNFGNSLGEDFSPTLKEKILKRDGYKCQNCQFGSKNSRDLVVDHRLKTKRGKKATLENGMTLCTRCNNIKSNHALYYHLEKDV